MRSDNAKAQPAPERALTRRQALAAGGGVALGAAFGLGYRTRNMGKTIALPLRPPGALVEADFLAACIRCGQCVEACPYDTLRLMDLGAGLKAGSPSFDAATNPCWLCQGYDSLKCIDACPTNALEAIDDPREVRIGLAVINEENCLAYNGAMCRVCWHACPYPNEAIVYDSMLRPTVDASVCTGCGLCEHGCPVEPKAIVIEPLKKRRASGGVS